jgi:menaquinone-dependent protoporphyrinogen oxidase
MMNILVTFASKHGATEGIAEHIAARLQARGHDADVRPIDAVAALGVYDAMVIGSGVYFGAWLKDAAEFVRRNQALLAAHPVWLFSSGPTGQGSKDAEVPPKPVAELEAAIHPRDHRIFFGALNHERLSWPERMVLRAVHAPEGDYRDWSAIEAWAESIAQALTPAATAISPA